MVGVDDNSSKPKSALPLDDAVQLSDEPVNFRNSYSMMT